jgi:hypothetical protein
MVREKDGPSAIPNLVPHLPQKFVSEGLSNWQRGQATVSFFIRRRKTGK